MTDYECSKCRTEIYTPSNYCSSCGNELKGVVMISNRRKKPISEILFGGDEQTQKVKLDAGSLFWSWFWFGR